MDLAPLTPPPKPENASVRTTVHYLRMKDGPNKGRRFFGCAKPRQESCNFFQWADSAATAKTPQMPPNDVVAKSETDQVCMCEIPAKLLRVNKEGARAPSHLRTRIACAHVPTRPRKLTGAVTQDRTKARPFGRVVSRGKIPRAASFLSTSLTYSSLHATI